MDAKDPMRIRLQLLPLLVGCLVLFSPGIVASGLPVKSSHPRLLLTPADLARLVAKKNANDPSWQALKALADTLTTYSVLQYDYCTRTDEPENTIFYDYQGEGWFGAALPLALAYKMTGNTAYLNKLLQLADEMIRANNHPDPTGVCASQAITPLPPLEPDDYYPTRYLGYTLAIIYDWCCDQLGATRKANLVALMNAYFDDLRANAYEVDDHADGNYYPSHTLCAASMGYASNGDNARAQEMIDFARLRFDGTPSSLVSTTDVPVDFWYQIFDGGYPSAATRDNPALGLSYAPVKSGFDFQGWAYGSGSFNRLVDYLLMVRSATGEDLLKTHLSWFNSILLAEKHALLPNHFEIDPTGEWGGDQGAVILRGLPARLAYVLAGSPDGPAAQHFAYSEIAESTFPDVTVFPLSEWEDFFFTDLTRPSQELSLRPYYSAFGPAYPQALPANGAMPYFIMRSDWGPDATWASASMGGAWFDDHQHYDAGNLTILRGNDYLAVEASNWKGSAGSQGIYGSSTEEPRSAAVNTLFFDDFGDYMWSDFQYVGGQAAWGVDQVVADEQNGQYTYVRSDLSKAYDRSSDPTDEPNRKLNFFYRSLLYLRSPNIFVVYDEVEAKTSTNPLGPYKKHLRWHFSNVPTIAGKTVQVDQGASRLYVDTLLPQNASLSAVDESNNPDPGYDYQKNSGTWRVEVRDPNNPLFIPFLTVLQPGPTGKPKASTSNLSSQDGAMVGAKLTQANGATDVVFFNNRAGQVPTPIASTSYRFSAPLSARHTLMGFEPGVRYSASFGGGEVFIRQRSCAGNTLASPAGVLQFQLLSLLADSAIAMTASPDPATVGQQFTYTLTVTNHGPSPATCVGVRDRLPARVKLVRVTPSQGACAGPDVRCDLETIATGASATVKMVVEPTAAGTIRNTAWVSANEPDFVPSNNTATLSTLVRGNLIVRPGQGK
jgi:uncharacterized repeat protein (TIGR01451 family)